MVNIFDNYSILAFDVKVFLKQSLFLNFNSRAVVWQIRIRLLAISNRVHHALADPLDSGPVIGSRAALQFIPE